MEKRLILAVVFSILVLSVWSRFTAKVMPPSQIQAVSPSQEAVTPEENVIPKGESPEESLTKEELNDFSTTKVIFAFDDDQGDIKDATFVDYGSYSFYLYNCMLLRSGNKNFNKVLTNSNLIKYVQSDESKEIIKEFIFPEDFNYVFKLRITYINKQNSTLKIDFPLLAGTLNFGVNPTESRYKDVTISSDKKILHNNGRKSLSFKDIDFISLRDRYFCVILQPRDDKFSGYIDKVSKTESTIGIVPVNLFLEPGQRITEEFDVYIGPQDSGILSLHNAAWGAVLYHGTFDVISHALLALLRFLDSIFHNWGLAIIALSILIYLILFPLSLKQMRSMKEMQVLQPKVEALRKTYKDNPQKLNKEIMELYRQHKVNPLGGCLPMILQIPIFFALYQALMRSISLKGAHFLWIKDLSEPDKLFVIPSNWPVIGSLDVNILPILMAIGMFFQQKITTAQTATGSSEQQKIMAIVFPFMFGFIFYRMPSGLVLYWFVNSSLMLANQLRMSKKK